MLFEKSQLLYPIKKKDYQSSPQLKAQWDSLAQGLESGVGRLTIFGYGAPITDEKAKEMLSCAFQSTNAKMPSGYSISPNGLTEPEIIDIANEDCLRKRWDTIIQSANYHCKFVKSFYDSSLAQYPRRPVEVYADSAIGGTWGCRKKYPISFSKNGAENLYPYSEIQKHIQPLLDEENPGVIAGDEYIQCGNDGWFYAGLITKWTRDGYDDCITMNIRSNKKDAIKELRNFMLKIDIPNFCHWDILQ